MSYNCFSKLNSSSHVLGYQRISDHQVHQVHQAWLNPRAVYLVLPWARRRGARRLSFLEQYVSWGKVSFSLRTKLVGRWIKRLLRLGPCWSCQENRKQREKLRRETDVSVCLKWLNYHTFAIHYSQVFANVLRNWAVVPCSWRHYFYIPQITQSTPFLATNFVNTTKGFFSCFVRIQYGTCEVLIEREKLHGWLTSFSNKVFWGAVIFYLLLYLVHELMNSFY